MPENNGDCVYLDTLYRNANNKTMIWDISVKNNNNVGVIEIKRGYINGKIQTEIEEIEYGKNIGKKNETTPSQQALVKAQSKWNVKVNKGGYTTVKEPLENDVKNKQVDKMENIQKIPYPMLAKEYTKFGHQLDFINNNVVGQPKLDGVRALIGNYKGEIVLMSRGGKKYNHLNHIRQQFSYLSNQFPPNTWIDVELYTHDLPFEKITGLCRKQKELTQQEKKDQLLINAHAFDCICLENKNLEFKKRIDIVTTVINKNQIQCPNFLIVKSIPITKETVNKVHTEMVNEGYEGLILRNITGEYCEGPSRSKHLQKYKSFQDDEFPIVGYHEGSGLESGCIIWECKISDGTVFSVRPRGTREVRSEYLIKADSYIGKKLTVRFQELSEIGVPRFPVGIDIRDYE